MGYVLVVLRILGIQIRNMKIVFNFYCTWRWITFEKPFSYIGFGFLMYTYVLCYFNSIFKWNRQTTYGILKYVCSITQEGVTKSTYPLDIFDSDLLCKENLSTNFLFESSWGRQKKNTFFLRVVALWAKVVQNVAYFIVQ